MNWEFKKAEGFMCVNSPPPAKRQSMSPPLLPWLGRRGAAGEECSLICTQGASLIEK